MKAVNPPSELLKKKAALAHELADVARKAILPYWRRPIKVESKIEEGRSIAQAESPVTIADRQAEMDMRSVIEREYPSDGIYGEEFGTIRTDADWVWVLDPIDGTKSFISGKPLFGTLIACLYKGTPVIGIIDQCVLDERWFGVLGQTSTLNGDPIQTNTKTALKDAMLFATTPDMFGPGEETEKFNAVKAAVLRPNYGTDCYAYALVASGFGADLVVEADLGLYDYCALVPVVEGAGGVMTDWSGRRLTLENHEVSRGRVVAASSPALHREALAILSADSTSKDTTLSFLSSAFQDPGTMLPVFILGLSIGVAASRRF